MGIILRCGKDMFYNSYHQWEFFKIELSKAFIKYIQLYNESLKNYSIDNEIQNTKDLFLNSNLYLNFFINNSECINNLHINGIHDLLNTKNNNGLFVYNKSEKILKTINNVKNHIDYTKININPYLELFNHSFTTKQNIYIL